MAVKLNQNILLRILPQNYKYHIQGISVRKVEEHPTEVKLEAHCLCQNLVSLPEPVTPS